MEITWYGQTCVRLRGRDAVVVADASLGLGVACGDGRRLRLLQVGFRASLSHDLDRRVDRDAMEPGPERRLAPKRPEPAPGAQEDVLGQVVGLTWAGHAPDQRVNPRNVRAIEALERGLVAPLRRGHGPGFVARPRSDPAGLRPTPV